MQKHHTQVLSALGLCLSAILSTSHAATTVGSFTGGDPGEGLDLQGTFIYAVNIGTVGEAGQAGDAYFTADDVEGVSITAVNEIPNWHSPEYGDSADDDTLEIVMRSIRWSPAPAKPKVELSNLTIGASYKLQLLFAEQCCANRGYDVLIDGVLAADEFNPAGIQGGAGNTTQGAVIIHEFVALSTSLTIDLDGTSASFGDKNPIINGLTLEQVAAPGDADNDTLPDAWENQYFGDLSATPGGDPDGDGLPNSEEFSAGSNPKLADTDSDGLSDQAEVKTYNTSPVRADTDGDGLRDNEEIATYKSDPLKKDTDSDLLSDFAEAIRYRTDATKADTDGDGASDYAEVHLLSDPLNAASFPIKTKANLFTGPDVGQGLDLSGTFPYAISFGNNGTTGQILDALFTADNVDGFTVASSQVADNWNIGVNFGDSAEQQVLSSVLASIRWSNSDNANKADVTLTFSNLEVGALYKLQLLFGERLWARGFNISIDGRLVAREFAPFQWQGGFTGPNGATPRDNGVVLVYRYVARANELVVTLDGRPVTDSAMPDHNAIVNGATLEIEGASVDSDADGLWDAWELEEFGDLSKKGTDDSDADGLTNAKEFELGTNPKAADTDDDGLKDGDEVNVYDSDPGSVDSDADGLSDGYEVNTSKTNPTVADTDGDGLSDGFEVNTSKTDPAKADTDGDGKSDGDEVALGTDALKNEAPTVISNVIVQAFTGGDPGEGLDLGGNFLYAFNVSSAGAAGKAYDADFTADSAPGITVTAPNNIAAWDNPQYGDSPADDVVEKVTQSIRYGSSVKVELTGLVPGSTYKLQLLFYEQCCNNRGFNLYADAELITENFSPPQVQGGVNNTSAGAVVSAEFVTQRERLVIMATTRGRSDPAFTDPNAILDGGTLEILNLVARPSLTLTPAANGQITIATDSTLEAADDVSGPYTALAQKSITFDPKTAGGRKFYRSRK